ncbi:MAG: RNA pseudouridine synthase [Epsilonproteobacteria bacterium]|nr:RNA pseudouridine synthase [Campylobacterota bacterium]
MKSDKAYKLLAKQEKISNRAAKELIDRGVVFSHGRKIVVARAEMPLTTKFKIIEIKKSKKIFEDEKVLAIDKPAFITSEEIAKKEGYPLLHRLDKETSGVLLLSKDEEFRKKAIEEFKKQNVLKEYIAWVEGVIAEPIEITAPIETIKSKNALYSKISSKGSEAYSYVEPLMIEGKFTKVKVTIKTGRTHQIRVHLKSINHPIVGDVKYGGREHKRIMLHAHKISLLGYEFISKEPKEFEKFF